MHEGRKPNQQRQRTLLLLLMLALFITGCNFPDLGGIDVPLPPGDGDGDGGGEGDGEGDGGDTGGNTPPGGLAVGDGPVSILRGQIRFADTNLPLDADIVFADEKIRAAGGSFRASVPQGTTGYRIETLMGRHTAELMHDGKNPKQLSFPAFPEWSPAYFNTLLMWGEGTPSPLTVRWPSGTTVPIWIQTSRQNPRVTGAATVNAEAALAEWEDILGKTIRFQSNNRMVADDEGITIRFMPQHEVAAQKGAGPNTIGLCSISYFPHEGRIARGHIYIAHEWQESWALLLHEIGHCIGLNHSDHEDDVMYPILLDRERSLSAKETQVARLLYSIPMATAPLPGAARTFATEDPVAKDPIPVGTTTYNPDGTITVTIPTDAPAD